MRAPRPIALAFGVLVLAAGSAAAQQTSTAETPGELVTDRPDFTESSQTIARETGTPVRSTRIIVSPWLAKARARTRGA